ncbi:transglutaminase family protein [Sporichthya brevicatena]|uniref:Transglutaminase family protein n=1 Tax=Sporichthya brevicatena TaxID=171442 RepID=A0ABN1H020_9ACTN
MTWRLKIEHRTRIDYEGEVLASYNEVRMTPLNDAAQSTLDARIQVSPSATGSRYWDYWGAYVTAFDVHVPHRTLALTATSVVETADTPPGGGAVGWETLRDDRVRDTHVEYLSPTAHTEVGPDLIEQVREIVGDAAPAEAARACAEWLRGEVRYVPGSTGVHTVAKEAWDARAGVCQDLAHLTVGLLRGLGVPARYVSGYLHPAPEAGIGETVTGQSHAWVEWWDGAWTPYDPTNGKPVGVEHVVVARGRDYWDVPPHKGVYAGPGGTSLSVEVDVTRVA